MTCRPGSETWCCDPPERPPGSRSHRARQGMRGDHFLSALPGTRRWAPCTSASFSAGRRHSGPAGWGLYRRHFRAWRSPRHPRGWGDGGRLLAFDRDPQAIVAGEAINDPRFRLVHAAFGDLAAGAVTLTSVRWMVCCLT